MKTNFSFIVYFLYSLILVNFFFFLFRPLLLRSIFPSLLLFACGGIVSLQGGSSSKHIFFRKKSVQSIFMLATFVIQNLHFSNTIPFDNNRHYSYIVLGCLVNRYQGTVFVAIVFVNTRYRFIANVYIYLYSMFIFVTSCNVTSLFFILFCVFHLILLSFRLSLCVSIYNNHIQQTID